MIHLSFPIVHQLILHHAGGAGVSMFASAFSLFRAPFRFFGSRESESVMNFASNGTLQCICGNEHPEGVLTDRRQFCRSCGCEVVAQNTAMLDKQLSRAEIRAMTRNMRNAAIRASRYELPPSVTTLEELNRYLAADSAKVERPEPPTRPTTVEQPQLH